MELDEMIIQISRVDTDEIQKLINAVFARKRELYPDWDIVYMALPKDNWEERKRTLDMVLKLEEQFQQESMEKEL